MRTCVLRARVAAIAAAALVALCGCDAGPEPAASPPPSAATTTPVPSVSPSLAPPVLEPAPAGSGPGEAPVPVDEAWLSAALSFQAGDQSWRQVADRAGGLLAPDAYVEVLAVAVLDAAVRDTTAHLGRAQVTQVLDVTDPAAYPPGVGVRVLAATVEFSSDHTWTRPPLTVTAELGMTGGLVSMVLIGEDGVRAGEPA